MSKKDYFVFDEIAQKPEVKALFDKAIEQINSGDLPRVNKHYPIGLMVDKQKLLGSSVLEYRLSQEPLADFHYEDVRAFTEKLREMMSWHEVDYELRHWVEKALRDPYFKDEGNDFIYKKWVLNPGVGQVELPENIFRFACDIAIWNLKYGPSYASVTANEIFDWVTQLGSDLPEQLNKHGTGQLPKALQKWTGQGVSATTNDALAVIRITQKEESEASYGQVLDYLIELLTTTDFPRSYAIEYRGPSKTYLPIKGLPKKGVHQLFASAAAYPGLFEKMEAYARAAISEFNWYQNLDEEDGAMPGSFAVFALALADTRFAPLVLHYLNTVDGEHQSMHGNFVEAYIDAHGFTDTSLAYLMACAGNIQHLRHRKTYPALMANAQSLQALIAARQQHSSDAPSAIAALRANMESQSAAESAFTETRNVIWGEAASKDNGRKLIASAPPELQALYEQIFAPAAKRLP
ncbi:hypothetical protein DZC30_00455 [Comamonas testosteroni]|uniref:Uncharacterized protein n=1 Tax=Comamonas testosteroni TaxID=285 RepID=A0A373FRY4_COMTE|nr:DUF6138 family protein [Comamonas testosteroni]RGE46923.1 hypothetical protein DZC30_00455 [Comamonas testosteroni]